MAIHMMAIRYPKLWHKWRGLRKNLRGPLLIGDIVGMVIQGMLRFMLIKFEEVAHQKVYGVG